MYMSADHRQILASLFGQYSWEIMPQIINGRVSQMATPWLKQLFDDLNELAHVDLDFDDIRKDLDGNLALLFDETHEDAVQRFITIDIKIIRRQYHAVAIPPPTSLQQNNNDSSAATDTARPTETVNTEHERQTTPAQKPEYYVCGIRNNDGKRCRARFETKRAFLCHMRFQHKVRHLIKSMVQTNECPYCRSTFATRATAQQHAVAAIATKTCNTDLGHYSTPLQPLTTLDCPLCEHTSRTHDEYQRHIIKHAQRRPVYMQLQGRTRLTPPRAAVQRFHQRKLRASAPEAQPRPESMPKWQEAGRNKIDEAAQERRKKEKAEKFDKEQRRVNAGSGGPRARIREERTQNPREIRLVFTEHQEEQPTEGQKAASAAIDAEIERRRRHPELEGSMGPSPDLFQKETARDQEEGEQLAFAYTQDPDYILMRPSSSSGPGEEAPKPGEKESHVSHSSGRLGDERQQRAKQARDEKNRQHERRKKKL